MVGFATSQFYAEPDPVVDLCRPDRMWHLGKVLLRSTGWAAALCER